jgi:hypothetical protein
MSSNSSLLRQVAWFVAGAALPLATFGQNVSKISPVPRDPLELVSGPVQAAGTREIREAALQLLARARQSYALRSARQAYDLKVTFMVNSAGATNHDGSWEMEDLFAPGVGFRWTARSSSGYTITRLSPTGAMFGDGTASLVPLRLHEARGALLDPIPSPEFANRGSIRTATAAFHGTTVTCVLLSHLQNLKSPMLGRAWEESEECIDPQSGLLLLHSEVPGRYAVYGYVDAPQFAGHLLPRTVTISEAGRAVSTISVQSLQAVPAIDPALFVPSGEMKAKGPATAITSTVKITRVHAQGPVTGEVTVRPVCVFGLVTPTGQLVEAHSLQPSDPNSQAAVDDARQIDFSPTIPAGARPQQHFVFVIENFISR